MKSTIEKNTNKMGSSINDRVKNVANGLLSDVPEITESLTEMGKTVLETLKGSTQKSLAVITASVSSLDRSVKRKPWAFIAGAGITAFAVGYMLGHRLVSSSTLENDLEELH